MRAVGGINVPSFLWSADGEGGENVALEVNSRSFNFHRDTIRFFCILHNANVRHFHVVVMQRRQTKKQKKEAWAKLLFCFLNPCFGCCSHCRKISRNLIIWTLSLITQKWFNTFSENNVPSFPNHQSVVSLFQKTKRSRFLVSEQIASTISCIVRTSIFTNAKSRKQQVNDHKLSF